MKKLAIIAIGAPGSGKSRWKDGFLKAINPNAIVLERDEYRKNLVGIHDDNNFHDTYYALEPDERKDIEKKITQLFDTAIKEETETLIFSNTNLTKKHRLNLVKKLKKNGWSVEYVVFDVDYELLKNRNKRRIDIVKESVVFDFYQKMKAQVNNIDNEKNINLADEISFISNSIEKGNIKKCVICDLDGTIAHIENDEFGKPNRTYFQYDERIMKDRFDDMVFSMVLAAAACETADIVFLTGRTADCIEHTEKWLNKHLDEFGLDINYQHIKLYTRALNDYRKDYIVKNEMLENLVLSEYDEVVCSFDDRPQCVDLWNSLGIKTIAVADQNNKF